MNHPQHTLCIRGGHVFDPANNLDDVLDIYIQNERIVAIGTAPEGFIANTTVDASGQHVFAGFIDLHSFLAEPGFTQKGTIDSETKAAAQSGFTTLCCTPNTQPVIDSAAVVALIEDKAKQAGHCTVLTLGALTANLDGEQLSNMSGLKNAGCVALTQLEKPFKNSHVIKQCYSYAAGFDITVMVTPMDLALANQGCMHEGPTSTQMGLAGIPVSAETSPLAQHLILCEETGARLHVSRVSSARALQMIIQAQQNGLPVTADVALGNLVFTDEDCRGYNSLMHVSPVYRSESDRKALLDGVNNGQLTICSNHFPQGHASKMAPFSASDVGINSLDSFTQVLLKLVHDEELSLAAAITAVTSAAAAVIHQSIGSISIGNRADVCIVDIHKGAAVQAKGTSDNADNLPACASNGANNPWRGQTFNSHVTHTINGGHIVYTA